MQMMERKSQKVARMRLLQCEAKVSVQRYQRRQERWCVCLSEQRESRAVHFLRARESFDWKVLT